jgi:hypothetical protein
MRIDKSTASAWAKTSGVKSLADVSRMTGVSRQTLTNWHRHKTELFGVVILGCFAKKDQDSVK